MKNVFLALSITLFGCSVYDASLLSRTDSLPDMEGDSGSSFASSSNGGTQTGGDTARAGAAQTSAGRGGSSQAAAGASTDASGGTGEDEAGSAGMAADRGGSSGSGGGGASSAGTGGQAGSASGSVGTGGAGGAGGAAPRELAQGKTATSSSQQVGNEPGKGNDTSLTTRWCASDNTLPQWWRVDLGASHVLTEVKVQFNHQDRQYTYVIETSPNDAVYTQRASLSGSGAVQTAIIPGGVSARYVRLTVTATQDLAWASFWDLSVFGY